MENLGNNTYQCEKDERIWINFEAFPDRTNVNISRSFDGEPLVVVTQNFISFKLSGETKKLTLAFDFINKGNCDIEILGENGGRDLEKARKGSIPDIKEFVFQVK